MINYSLRCAQDHAYDSWFQSAAAYDRLAADGRVTCPVCGTARVEKSLMTPAVRPARAAASKRDAMPSPRPERPPGDIEAALSELRRRVEENSDYVGTDFAAEARRIHDGDAPERSIYGEARPDEARKLIEDGVPVAPLPFIPVRKTH
jgi:hypothetical protein